MGSSESKNDDFGSNPNFNMGQHRQAMQHMGSNYTPAVISYSNSYSHQQAAVQQTEFKKVTRTCSIYKPSFTIRFDAHQFHLEFDYDSTSNSKLEVYAGVSDVKEDQLQITVKIDSRLRFDEELPAGKKMKFSKSYPIPIDGTAALEGSTLIVRAVSTVQREATEYSLRKAALGQWKVLLQKLELNGIVTQLQNIYKGDESNECLICLTVTSNTLIEPCNHLCVCSECLKSMRQSTNKCPICRTPIAAYKVIVGESE